MKTATRAIARTLHTMSPEQCARLRHRSSQRHLFIGGGRLFPILAGEYPVRVHAHDLEIAVAHLRQTPKPLGEKVPSLPADLSAVVGHACKKIRRAAFRPCASRCATRCRPRTSANPERKRAAAGGSFFMKWQVRDFLLHCGINLDLRQMAALQHRQRVVAARHHVEGFCRRQPRQKIGRSSSGVPNGSRSPCTNSIGWLDLQQVARRAAAPAFRRMQRIAEERNPRTPSTPAAATCEAMRPPIDLPGR